MTYREETDDWDRGDAAPITPPDPGRGICPTCGLWAKLGETEASAKSGGEEHTPTADAIWGAFCRQQIAPTRLRISHATLRALREEVGGSSYFGDQAAFLDDPVNPRFMSMAVDEVPAAEADAPGWQVMRAEESDALQARK